MALRLLILVLFARSGGPTLRTIRLSHVVFITLIALTRPASAATTIEAQSGDASVTHDTAAATWTLKAGGATLTVALDANHDFQFVSLTSPSGHNWLARAGPGTSILADGTTLVFGSKASGFQFESATTAAADGRLQLDAAFSVKSPALRVTRHLAVADASPTFEVWTTYEATGVPATVSNLNAIQLQVPAGTVRYLTGLQGDSADTSVDTVFTLKATDIAGGGALSLGADGRSSAQTVPWFAVDGGGDELYSALMWSGAWSLTLNRTASALDVSFGLAPMQTVVTTTAIDGPHVLVGVASGGLNEAAAGLRSYVLNGLRGGRAIEPLVTYNTWFAYGTEIDESTMRVEMAHAAALGSELFVIDAGWYAGAGASGPFDFDSGLGTWEVDAVRFPNGLAPLRDYAHSLGMKFGIWVEPERVNLSPIGAPGAEEPWLATSNGDYGTDHAAQICLASAAGRQWVFTQLENLIDTVQPDYLKWDNNFWINCDRDGHGHGTTDGNFRHVTGLYDVLATLRQRYPDLLIENVSGGGNRLDYGMLRYTDVAWMDDRTAPSAHVRHNIEGLSAVFPPAYLLSFVTDHVGEPLHDSPDLPLYIRSRMAGALGLCFRSDSLAVGDLAEIAGEIDLYKNLRATLSVAAGMLLSDQAAQSDAPAWDVLQAAAPDATSLVVYAYQTDQSSEKVTVKPQGLDPSATYAVTSVDAGPLGSATGTDLMSSGIDVLQSSTAAHILTLTVEP